MDNPVIIVLIYLASVALSLAILYAIIKSAVLAALREHTRTSQTAVIVQESVPLRIQSDAPTS